MFFCGANPDVTRVFPMYFTNQKDKAAYAPGKGAIARAQLNDAFVDLPQENARIDHFRRQGLVEFVCRYHGTQGFVAHLGHGVMDNAQLGTQLTVRTGGINLAEALFPEPATHRQQGIVFDDNLMVFGAFRNARALKLA